MSFSQNNGKVNVRGNVFELCAILSCKVVYHISCARQRPNKPRQLPQVHRLETLEWSFTNSFDALRGNVVIPAIPVLDISPRQLVDSLVLRVENWYLTSKHKYFNKGGKAPTYNCRQTIIPSKCLLQNDQITASVETRQSSLRE